MYYSKHQKSWLDGIAGEPTGWPGWPPPPSHDEEALLTTIGARETTSEQIEFSFIYRHNLYNSTNSTRMKKINAMGWRRNRSIIPSCVVFVWAGFAYVPRSDYTYDIHIGGGDRAAETDAVWLRPIPSRRCRRRRRRELRKIWPVWNVVLECGMWSHSEFQRMNILHCLTKGCRKYH